MKDVFIHSKYPKEYYLSCIHVSMAMVLMNVKEQTKRYCKMKPKNKIDMLKAAIAEFQFSKNNKLILFRKSAYLYP